MGISKDLTEEDVKFRYINEAITNKGWSKDRSEEHTSELQSRI